ncbi:MAG: hypothetical protein KGZ79_07685 [Dethiobacter sp.]|nr:hypothetical protein [Dethiobacter sp.]
MRYLQPGNAVKVGGRIAILLYEIKDSVDHWGVLFLDGDEVEITYASAKRIRPRIHHCWGKDCGDSVDSVNNLTCPKCHWLICNVCGRCRQDGCVDDNVKVESPPDLWLDEEELLLL